MDATTLIGLAGGLLTTISLVPQAAKIWKSKSAHDISLRMFIAFCLGIALWLVYGILQKEVPIILWNSVSLVLGIAILGMKLRFG